MDMIEMLKGIRSVCKKNNICHDCILYDEDCPFWTYPYSWSEREMKKISDAVRKEIQHDNL